MARDDPTIYLRIPAELKERLEASAAENRRSVTAEVVARLQYSFRSAVKPSEEPDGDDWEVVRRLSRRRDDLTARLTMLNAYAMQLEYELRAARGSDTSAKDLEDLRQQASEVRRDAYDVRVLLDKVSFDLDEAYAKVDGKLPTGALRITRGE